MCNVKLVSITTPVIDVGEIGEFESLAEAYLAYVARVSSPRNQLRKTAAGLLRHCIEERHWSVFEMVDLTFEVETSRAVAAQIIRHRSLCVQEFSQRYSDVGELGDLFEPVHLRRQDTKNRQNSFDDLPPELVQVYTQRIDRLLAESEALYRDMLKDGVAKETARMILPMTTRTRLYIKGSVRSWIHYIEVRTDPSAQLEHRRVAEAIRGLLAKELPIVAEACDWPEAKAA